ncbi:MAG: GNAT family N-acetyltransferase [Parachlamydiaceae bacterium]
MIPPIEGRFTILPIPREEYPAYAGLMQQWKDDATLFDTKVVCEHMENAITRAKPSVFTQAIVCKDENQIVRSIALIKFDEFYSKDPQKKKNYLKLSYIATSPQFTKQGTGRLLMNYLMELGLREKVDGIYLNSIESAKDFYEKKMLFKPITTRLSPYDEKDDGPFPMLLSAQKMDELIKRNHKNCI